jgi:NitT/TauT family transport system substrate-binding protein
VEQLLTALNSALQTIKNDRDNTGDKLHKMYFNNLERSIWDVAWNATINAYPGNLSFNREAYDYWIKNDPKGAESYKNIDYKNVVYDKAQ